VPQPFAPAGIEPRVASSDEYRNLAEETRRQIERTPAGDIREALRRLADAYDRKADAMDGKRLSPRLD
jgi:hypothetical protein